jgi:hypothetical protein
MRVEAATSGDIQAGGMNIDAAKQTYIDMFGQSPRPLRPSEDHSRGTDR